MSIYNIHISEVLGVQNFNLSKSLPISDHTDVTTALKLLQIIPKCVSLFLIKQTGSKPTCNQRQQQQYSQIGKWESKIPNHGCRGGVVTIWWLTSPPHHWHGLSQINTTPIPLSRIWTTPSFYCTYSRRSCDNFSTLHRRSYQLLHTGRPAIARKAASVIWGPHPCWFINMFGEDKPSIDKRNTHIITLQVTSQSVSRLQSSNSMQVDIHNRASIPQVKQDTWLW